MEKKVINTHKAPEAIGPYSQAVSYNGILYCSGQIALDPHTMKIISDDIESQCRQVMKNLGEVLKAGSSDWSKVIKCSIFLESMDDFPVVNEIYGSFFKKNPPARETVAVRTLPKNVKVEISCIANCG